jgi:hypothetical protein
LIEALCERRSSLSLARLIADLMFAILFTSLVQSNDSILNIEQVIFYQTVKRIAIVYQ